MLWCSLQAEVKTLDDVLPFSFLADKTGVVVQMQDQGPTGSEQLVTSPWLL